jgi:hypothetical protein
MDDNVKTLLDKIQELKAPLVSVYVNSAKPAVDCTPLSFKQQKDLISTVADGVVGSLKFQKILNGVVMENTALDDLKTTDRLPIILQLRANAIGDQIRVGGEKGKLSPILKKIKKFKVVQSKTITGDLTVEVEVPTLASENRIIQVTIDLLKKDGEAEVGKNIGNVYTHEIVKYIKSIKFGEQELVFLDIPVSDRAKIVDNLPISINKQIIEFIQDIKKAETELLTIELNGETKILEIDVGFFDS